MYEIKKLEEKWETFHRRRRSPFYIASAFIALFILIALVWFGQNSDDQSSQTMVKNKMHGTKTPSMEQNSLNPIAEKPEAKPIVNKKSETGSKKVLKIDISDILSTNAFEEVEERFYETKDTDDSLFLARSYFKKGEYEKALYWALQTNKINDSIEEAWLIFAESKYKTGKKREAIKILKSYIQRSNSLKAKGLLGRLK